MAFSELTVFFKVPDPQEPDERQRVLREKLALIKSKFPGILSWQLNEKMARVVARAPAEKICELQEWMGQHREIGVALDADNIFIQFASSQTAPSPAELSLRHGLQCLEPDYAD